MKKEIITVTCDICHEPDAREFAFGMSGIDYRIDLCELHRDSLVLQLEPFIKGGHKMKLVHHIVRRDKAQVKPVLTPTENATNARKATRAKRAAKDSAETNGKVE